MMRTMLKSKIHRATVTQADLHYVGSVTIDEDLLDAADLLPGEQVAIVDVTNGARLKTRATTSTRACSGLRRSRHARHPSRRHGFKQGLRAGGEGFGDVQRQRG